MVGPQGDRKIAAIREIAGQTTQETRYYPLSRVVAPERFNAIVRSHWGIENQLHLAAGLERHDAGQAGNRYSMHRNGFRLYWRWQSRSRHSGRPQINSKTRDLIRQMAAPWPIFYAANK